MRSHPFPLRRVLLAASSLWLLGCPHLFYAVPTLLNHPPRFAGGAAEPRFVPVRVDFQTEGHFLLYRLRVDGRNLEPSAGGCRRWFLRRGAREAEAAPRSFCHDDQTLFYLAAGAPHTVELLVESTHTVVNRRYLQPGSDLRWKMPIASRPIELSIDPEAGRSYTLRAREKDLDLRQALTKDAPSGTDWDPKQHAAIFYAGRPVGTLEVEVLRGARHELVSEVSAPLYSGRMVCGPPFRPPAAAAR